MFFDDEDVIVAEGSWQLVGEVWLGEFASTRSTYATRELGDTTQYRNQVTAHCFSVALHSSACPNSQNHLRNDLKEK